MEVKEDYNPNGVKICFYEEEHVYETNDCSDFISVTTFIEKFFPVFDQGSVSRAYAEKHGLNQSEVIEKWERKKDLAAQIGTKVHLYCERSLLGEKKPSANLDVEKQLFSSADKALNGLKKKYDLVKAEKIVFSEKRKLAGMIDLLMREKKTGKLYIIDWKTNKSLDKENKWNKFGFVPINHVDDTNFYHYALQLSFYKNMLLEEKYFDEDIELRIVHLTPSKPIWIEVPDMTKEYNDMVNFDFEKQKKMESDHSVRIKNIKKELKRINKKFNN